jgi:hypothetical protein
MRTPYTKLSGWTSYGPIPIDDLLALYLVACFERQEAAE